MTDHAQARRLQSGPIDVTVVGFAVVTTDGTAGRVADPVMDLSNRFLLVSIRRFFRKTRLVPLTAIELVDKLERKVFLKWTTAELKQAPEDNPLPWQRRAIDYRPRNHG
jgi:hypothetical protein